MPRTAEHEAKAKEMRDKVAAGVLDSFRFNQRTHPKVRTVGVAKYATARSVKTIRVFTLVIIRHSLN